MDWAIISKTLTRLETLDSDELALELERLQSEDPALCEQIESLRATGKAARSFMQTRMPEADEHQTSMMQPGDRIDIWKIESPLGAGGMGEVFEATRDDGLFEQRVALKIARNPDKGLSERFEGERNRLAQLEHPNIARIVDGGTTESGAPYMTMEFVEGVPIDAHVKSARLGRQARLGLIVRLCEALSHAHGRLVLHRDIKHDNVLINTDGELRLIDFGVASLLDDPDSAQGRGPLTIAFAAPEQLLGNPVSAATDIFAVGMLTHMLETGALPARQSDGGVGINAARIGDADLAAILTKATTSDPAARYGSIDAMGDDLEKLLGGFPVSARPIPTLIKFKKLIGRNKLASGMSAAAIAAAIAGVIGVSAFALQANEARAEAELRAEEAEHFLQENDFSNAAARLSANMSQRYMIEDQGLDEARFRSYLIQKANEAQAGMSENPDDVAALHLFVGRYLSNRGDYAKSGEILGFLINAEEAPDIGVQSARVIQARNLRELGDSEGAEQELRAALGWMKAKPYLFESPAYARVALSLALSTQDEADVADAIRANLAEATDPEIDESTRAYYYNSLAVLVAKQKDFDKVVEYAIESVELSKRAKDTNAISVNTRSLNLVGYILHHKRDVALAREYWPSEEDVMDPEKGHLRHRSMHRLFEAYALQIEGDHVASHEKAKAAHELAEQEYPVGSPYHLTTAGLVIETGALAGMTDEVRPLLADVMMPLDREGGEPHARGMLARAYLLNAEGNREEALRQYRELDKDRVAGSLELTYKANVLKSLLGIS
ncbi:MAG: serine/threonine-protein kinase [Pseudomonadota bacterium]